MAEGVGGAEPTAALRKILVPLALAQFICSFAGSNMNVMITDISKDLDTTVQGVQVAITIFLLVMAALMIPGGQADRPVGPQAVLHDRPHDLRDRRVDQRGLAGSRRPDPRQLDLRRCRHRPVDPARLHPHDAALHRHHVAGPGLRRDHRDGRHRRRRRTVDRRSHHHRDQLAGGVRLPSAGHRGDRLPEPLDRRSGRARPDPPLRHARSGPVGRRSGPGRDGRPRRRQQPRAHGGPGGGRRHRARAVLRAHSRPANARARSRCCPRRCSATGRRTSGSSPRTCSGCCSSEPRSSSPRTSRSFVATTPSKPA